MSNKCVQFLLLISLAVLVNGQIPSVGFCPDYLPMTDFDMNRFLGKWYEAERYFTFTEVVSRCVVTDYAKAPSGRIYVSNEVTNRLTGVKRVINGNLQLVGKGDEGKIHVKYATTPIPTESTLTVLETDYDNYAIIWSCSGFGPIHAQNAWLMTRERLPSGNVLQKAYGILDKFKISRTFFVKTDQEGCYLAASDINAANGITATSTVPEATGAEQREENFRTAGVVPEDAPVVQSEAVKAPEPLKEEIAEVAKPVDVKAIVEEAKPVTVAEHILKQEEVTKGESKKLEVTKKVVEEAKKLEEVKNPAELKNVVDIKKPEDLKKSVEIEKPQEIQKSEEIKKAEEIKKPELIKKPEETKKTEEIKEPEVVQNVEEVQEIKKPEEATLVEKKPEDMQKEVVSDEKTKSNLVKS